MRVLRSSKNLSSALFAVLAASSITGCALEPDAAPAAAPVDADAEGAEQLGTAWQALVAGGAPAVRWGHHGTPTSLFGTISSASRTPGVAAARQLIAEHAALFKLDLAQLGDETSVASPLGSHVAFAQRVDGVHVHGAEIKVSFNRAGDAIAVANTTLPELAISTVPALSAQRALDRALAAANGDRGLADPADTPELVIVDRGAPTLAYRAIVPTNAQTLEIFIDARTGAVLGEPADINRYVNGTGQVFKDNAVVATQNNNLVDSNDAASAVPTSAYSTVTLQGLAGTNKLDGTFASGSNSRSRATGTNNNFIFTRNTVAFSETMAYFHIDYAQRYIQSLGFTNVNNRQQVFAVDRSTDDNSSYSPSTKRITFGTGGVDDAEDGEVIVHEYGHSVQDNQVPGFGASAEGGAMGEGFGDYLAATVNAALAGDYQILCVAEWDAVSYASGSPHCLRRLDSTKHYPGDKTGEVHDDGEMWSASLYQIRTALGAAKADKLVIQAHFLLGSSANFKDGANALVTAAINLGYTTAEVASVRTILKNRGFTVTA